MKKLLAMIMILAMVFSMAACGNSGGEEQSEDPGTRAINLRMSTSLASTDWEQTTLTSDMLVWHQMFEGLYGMDEANNGYYEELADGVDISEDGMTYTIHLREGVTFQNGEPLKASDVKFSYDRAMANSRFNYVTEMIEEVSVQDDATVVFKLNKPYSAIQHTFFTIKIASEKEVTEQGDQYGTIPHKAGTGAYYVTEYDAAAGVKLEAYEGYWRGAPAIKTINYNVISDNAAAVIAYENGELDYLPEVSLADWESVSSKEGGQSTMLKGNNIVFLAINYLSPTNDGVLANEKVRQAICHAVNKADINIGVSDGYGAEATEYMPHEYVPTQPSEGFVTYDYDLEKAKALLAEAGYPDGVDVGTIMTYGQPDAPNAKTAQVIQGNLAAAGITAEVQVSEYSAVESQIYSQEYDLLIFGDSGNYDFNNIRQQVHSDSVGMYVIRFKDEKSPFDWQRLEELCDLGVSTADLDQRLEYYTELWSIVMDSATIQPCHHKPVGIAWSGDLEIGEPVPMYYKVRTFSWK